MCFDLCHLGGFNGGRKYPVGQLQKDAQYLMLQLTLVGREDSGSKVVEYFFFSS